MVVYTLQRFSSQPLNISERKKLKTLSFSWKTHSFKNAVQGRNIWKRSLTALVWTAKTKRY